MQNYGDIIKRIVEIIILSEEKKKELNNLYYNEYNKYFTTLYDYDIYRDYVPEFRDLLMLEKVFYNLKYDSQALAKNRELLNVCRENATTPDYLSLAEIIKKAEGKSALEITYFSGYYILKESLNDFKELCRKLKIEPFVKLIDTTSETVLQRLEQEKEEKQKQYKRINYYLEQLVPQNIAEKNDEDFKDISKKNKGFAYVKFLDKLTKATLSTLKDVMSDNDYQELLDDLVLYQKFKEKDLEKLRGAKTKKAKDKIKVVDSIDELISYFASLEDLDVATLKLLIPSIGVNNYSYLMDGLYKIGKIDIDVYLDSIKDYLGMLEQMEKKA